MWGYPRTLKLSLYFPSSSLLRSFIFNSWLISRRAVLSDTSLTKNTALTGR